MLFRQRVGDELLVVVALLRIPADELIVKYIHDKKLRHPGRHTAQLKRPEPHWSTTSACAAPGERENRVTRMIFAPRSRAIWVSSISSLVEPE